MDPKVTLSEQSQEIRKLALEGKTPRTIAASTRLSVPTVMYRLRVLRKLGEVPYVRPRKSSVGEAYGPPRVDGILSASVEEIKIITCPHCKTKVQVLG